MPLEQKSREERPGAFLSLSAPGPFSSPSPLRAYPAADTSLKDLVKQEKRELETCLSLQQPSQGASGQQEIACDEPSHCEALVRPRGPGQHILAYVQETHTSGQHTAPYLEEPQDRQAATPCSQGLDQQHGVCYFKEPRDQQTTLLRPRGSGQHCLALVQKSQPSLSSKQPSAQYLEERHNKQVPPPCPKGLGQYILAYVQEPHTSDQHSTHSLEEFKEEQKAEATPQTTSPFAEKPQASEHLTLSQKTSPFLASAEQQKPVSWKGCSQEQCPATLLGLSEQQKPSSCSASFEHQRLASLPNFPEQQEVSAYPGFSLQSNFSSLQRISEQQQLGHVEQSSAGSLHGQQKHSSMESFERQKLWISEQQQLGHVEQSSAGSLHGQQKHSSTEAYERQKLRCSQVEEKPVSLQEVNVLHRPESSSLELDATCEGLLAKQKVALHSEEQQFSSSHAPPGQLTSTQGCTKEHESADVRSRILQGSLDYGKGLSLQEYSNQQKSESSRELSPKQGSLEQKVYHAQFILPQQGFKVRPSPMVYSPDEGKLCSEPIVTPNSSNQDGVLNEREHLLSKQSSHGCLASRKNSEQVYPIPLATHMAVLADEGLFTKTLQSLHAALGLQVSVQKIGEIAMNLHKLYKEVTCRGGLEMVIKCKKWNEIIGQFNFPGNVTATASILERSYIDALYHYEQVYFMGARRKIAVPAMPINQSEQEAANMLTQDLDALESGLSTPRGIINAAHILGVDPASSVGAMVRGAIDGKFENGYLVTVMVGARKLRGVLYHVASTNALPQNACVPSMMQNLGSELKSSDLVPRAGRKRKKTEVYRKDPNAPRQNRTGYNFFFAEQRAKLKTMQPDKDRAISKMIGELWNKLSEDEKTPYQAEGVKDKERYVREMREYKEKVKLPLIAPNYAKVVPLRSSSMYTPGLSPQLPQTYISEAMNGSKIVSSQPLSKAVPAQLPLACTSEAAKTSHPGSLLVDNKTSFADPNPSVETGPNASTAVKLLSIGSKTLPVQLPSACMSEALDRSQLAPLLLGNATFRADQQFSVGTATDSSIAVNRTNADVVMSMSDASATEDTSAVAGMAYVCTDRKAPEHEDELSQSNTKGGHSFTGSENNAERELHITPMEQ